MCQSTRLRLAIVLLLLTACGGGSGEASDIQAGLYSGTATYRAAAEADGSCREFIQTCFGSFIEVQVSEQFFSDGSSKLVLETPSAGLLGEAEALSSSIEFSQSLPERGPCGFVGGDLFCSGLRTGSLNSLSQRDRVLEYNSSITATCRSNSVLLECEVTEQAALQG